MPERSVRSCRTETPSFTEVTLSALRNPLVEALMALVYKMTMGCSLIPRMFWQAGKITSVTYVDLGCPPSFISLTWICHLYCFILPKWLDWDISVEEIEAMIHKLKKGKSPGPNGLTAEHITYGGTSITLWLKYIFNHILSCETIPHCFKLSITTPSYKGPEGQRPYNQRQL